MKNKSQHKSTMTMSYSAFQSHACKQAKNVKQIMIANSHDATKENVKKAYINNPLALLTTIGISNSMSQEESRYFFTLAAIQFDKLFGKFLNLNLFRYMVVVQFLDNSYIELLNNLDIAQSVIRDCHEWVYDKNADIEIGLKECLNSLLMHAEIESEAEYIAEHAPQMSESNQQQSVFKI